MADDILAQIAAPEPPRADAMGDARRRPVLLGPKTSPHAADGYCRLRIWRGRLALVPTVPQFARQHGQAAALALTALEDRGVRVRSAACATLAFSLRRSALPALERAATDTDTLVAAVAEAAIDAIRHQNQHCCPDCTHSGRVCWNAGVLSVDRRRHNATARGQGRLDKLASVPALCRAACPM